MNISKKSGNKKKVKRKNPARRNILSEDLNIYSNLRNKRIAKQKREIKYLSQQHLQKFIFFTTIPCQ